MSKGTPRKTNRQADRQANLYQKSTASIQIVPKCNVFIVIFVPVDGLAQSNAGTFSGSEILHGQHGTGLCTCS